MIDWNEIAKDNVVKVTENAIRKLNSQFKSELITVNEITARDRVFYLWVAVNYLLGRFEPVFKKVDVNEFAQGSVIVNVPSVASDDKEDSFLCVGNNSERKRICRKTTYGVMDMGASSLQIAFEFDSPKLVSI